VGRRALITLLFLALLLAPVANAWCSTVCLAAAITDGCAHGLQPTDDLPVEKAAPVEMAVLRPLAVPESVPARGYAPMFSSIAQHTPLRL
jgi:hypothetical protein